MPLSEEPPKESQGVDISDHRRFLLLRAVCFGLLFHQTTGGRYKAISGSQKTVLLPNAAFISIRYPDTVSFLLVKQN